MREPVENSLERVRHVLRAAMAAICIMALWACGTMGQIKPKILTVPVTYERHLAAVRNCTPFGVMLYSKGALPNGEDFLALVFALRESRETSTSHYESGGSLWRETSWRQASFAGYRVYKCPHAFIEKIRADMTKKEVSK